MLGIVDGHEGDMAGHCSSQVYSGSGCRLLFRIELPMSESAAGAGAFPSPLVGEGGSARSAEPDEGCWKKLGDAKLEHPSSDRASLGHLLPQGEKEDSPLTLSPSPPPAPPTKTAAPLPTCRAAA
jgi:hypothetical protein